MIRPATVAGRALDILFPPRCVAEGCNEVGAFICSECLTAAPRATGARCAVCWEPIEHGSCRACSAHSPAFTALRSPVVYTGPWRQAIHALKFNGVTAVAPLLGELAAALYSAWRPPVDAIVPVPLSGRRQRSRGFNQAELLAKEVTRASGLPIERHWLKRARHTQPQTEQTDAAARRLNVKDAFAPGRDAPRGSVLLIDDVATTGATLDACARVLLHSGASAVYGLTVARAVVGADK